MALKTARMRASETVGSQGLASGSGWGGPRIAAGLLAAALLAGCAGRQPASCGNMAGVGTISPPGPAGPLAPRYIYSGFAPMLRHLQCRSGRGDKDAKLALGRFYEAGLGVAQDLGRAAALYAEAARAEPSTISLYSPPVTKGGAGQVIRVPNPNASPGLAEAKYRLGRMYLEGRGVPRDLGRGRKLIQEALAQGYLPPPPPGRRVGAVRSY